jgi:predicted DNA-binding ribbon-helix-helix protein
MPPTLLKPAVIKRSVVINSKKTSVSLEQAFWDEVKAIAAERQSSLNRLISEIDEDRQRVNLSSALRLVVLARLGSRVALAAADVVAVR